MGSDCDVNFLSAWSIFLKHVYEPELTRFLSVTTYLHVSSVLHSSLLIRLLIFIELNFWSWISWIHFRFSFFTQPIKESDLWWIVLKKTLFIVNWRHWIGTIFSFSASIPSQFCNCSYNFFSSSQSKTTILNVPSLSTAVKPQHFPRGTNQRTFSTDRRLQGLPSTARTRSSQWPPRSNHFQKKTDFSELTFLYSTCHLHSRLATSFTESIWQKEVAFFLQRK